MAIFIGPLHYQHYQFCQAEDISCSLPTGTTPSVRPFSDNRKASDLSIIGSRCRNVLFGSAQLPGLQVGQEASPSRVGVAADYPDFVHNTSRYIGTHGYHPLEEVKEDARSRDKMLSNAEVARTVVEAHSSALLVFPGMVHSEPHQSLSWAEFQYVVDDYGDIFFEIFDDENILQDRDGNSPVNVLIGMDLPVSGERERITSNDHDSLESRNDDVAFDDIKEIRDTEVASTLIDWGMPETLRTVHPIYFAKHLNKAINTKYGEKMEHPSNGLSIVGYLRPAFVGEESHLRKLFDNEDIDGYMSDWKDEPEIGDYQMEAAYNLIGYGGSTISTLYKLEMLRIELFTVYGVRSLIGLQDFQEAEPDVLVHSASSLIEHFSEDGMKCNMALKTLCRKKKGLTVEGANLIGVDSLGMDVRAFSGVEAQTLRFSFNSRVTSEIVAEKKIRRMLFPRYYRRSFRAISDGYTDSDPL